MASREYRGAHPGGGSHPCGAAPRAPSLVERSFNRKMPRSATQLQALREDARDRLERAALRVFARLGYRRATVRDVAAEAGVAVGLLYHYFRGKEALLLAVFERGARDVAASFDA